MLELFLDALNLMVIGMGFVFVFLAILVVATKTMSKVITRFQPAVVKTSTPQRRTAQRVSAPEIDDRTKAAITAAIKQHRASKHG